MSDSDCESFSDESNCESPTGRTLVSAPSDECTVNEVREAEARKEDKYKTTITNSGSSNGKTQVSGEYIPISFVYSYCLSFSHFFSFFIKQLIQLTTVKIKTVPFEPRPLNGEYLQINWVQR